MQIQVRIRNQIVQNRQDRKYRYIFNYNACMEIIEFFVLFYWLFTVVYSTGTNLENLKKYIFLFLFKFYHFLTNFVLFVCFVSRIRFLHAVPDFGTLIMRIRISITVSFWFLIHSVVLIFLFLSVLWLVYT